MLVKVFFESCVAVWYIFGNGNSRKKPRFHCLCGWFSKIVFSLTWCYSNIEGFFFFLDYSSHRLVLCVCNMWLMSVKISLGAVTRDPELSSVISLL